MSSCLHRGVPLAATIALALAVQSSAATIRPHRAWAPHHQPAVLPDTTFATLYSFKKASMGIGAHSGLVTDRSGALYGTTLFGGPGCGRRDCGTVYKLTKKGGRWKETVLYAFSGGADGRRPEGDLIIDKSGALYGVTAYGGSCTTEPSGGCGVVFKLTPTQSGYTQSVVYSFQGGSDGFFPQAGLLAGKHGVLYGTTSNGGYTGGYCSSLGCGTVFKLTPAHSGYTETVIYRFLGTGGGNHDGTDPDSPLITDANGALYGTTAAGGVVGQNQTAAGIVFKLTPSGSIYAETILHTFTGPDGFGPGGGVIADSSGALYGTTIEGGGDYLCMGQTGCGVVYKLTPSGPSYVERTLYAFVGGSDGALPVALSIIDGTGALYGTTLYGGGIASGCFEAEDGGCGTVFKLTPSGSNYSESIVHAFAAATDGGNPTAGLLADKHGVLFGTTFYNGSGGGGTAYSLTP
jgi:uncharacterized repeat protein (TIGR03803 family)